MTATVHAIKPPSSAASFLSRFAGLRARLPGDLATRDAAAALLDRQGLPGPRDEAWKYTSLRPLADTIFHEALTEIDGARVAIPAAIRAALPDTPALVFAAGRFRRDLSVLPPAATIHRFANLATFGDMARPQSHPMVALNTMLAEDGAVIEVAADTDAGTILLISLGADLHQRPIAFHPRHTIRLGPRARLTMIEVSTGTGAYLHNPVTEITLSPGAHFTHLRLQDEAPEAFHFSTIYAEIEDHATYDGFTLALGARLSRSEIHARLTGPHAHAALNAAQILRAHQHADFTTVVSHDAPHGTSRQTVKNVLAGHARGVFQGKIEVARAAQKTDGYQMNQALLLSPDAEIDCKPQLEIFADDVKCSHGATVGELDRDQLFYLTSRGIPQAEARAILVRAFLAEAIDQIPHEAARALFDATLTRWWDTETP